jgi:hypothetical protein
VIGEVGGDHKTAQHSYADVDIRSTRLRIDGGAHIGEGLAGDFPSTGRPLMVAAIISREPRVKDNGKPGSCGAAAATAADSTRNAAARVRLLFITCSSFSAPERAGGAGKNHGTFKSIRGDAGHAERKIVDRHIGERQ